MRPPLFALVLGLVHGCSPSQSEPVTATPAPTTNVAPSPTADRTAAPIAGPLESFVGTCVRATGYTAGAKIGPQLLTVRGKLWVMPRPGEIGWGSMPGGVRVEVRGIVRERKDLPVFIQRPDEPIMQGMPMPEGTDLDQARRRLVIEDVAVTVVRQVADVERDLAKAVGTLVSLDGTVWSLNDTWWFNHDGVEIHLEGRDKLPDFSKLHGETATLRGKLERRPMPRLDQITLKPQRDLAEAYVLSLESKAPHPGWPLEGC